MGLNIKNEETHSFAAVLVELTGETLTAAVTVAIRERLERVQRQGNVLRYLLVRRISFGNPAALKSMQIMLSFCMTNRVYQNDYRYFRLVGLRVRRI